MNLSIEANVLASIVTLPNPPALYAALFWKVIMFLLTLTHERSQEKLSSRCHSTPVTSFTREWGKSLDATGGFRCSRQARRLHVACTRLSFGSPPWSEGCRTKTNHALWLSIIRPLSK